MTPTERAELPTRYREVWAAVYAAEWVRLHARNHCTGNQSEDAAAAADIALEQLMELERG